MIVSKLTSVIKAIHLIFVSYALSLKKHFILGLIKTMEH